MYIKIIAIIVLLIMMYLIFFKKSYETFYNITPYNLHWDIYKCLEGDCVVKESYKCYEYCRNIAEDGARQQCEIECLDIGDEVYDFLKYQNYNWPLLKANKYFKNYSILNDTNDYVNV